MSTILGCECHEVNGQHAAWCPAHPRNNKKPTPAAAPGPREQFDAESWLRANYPNAEQNAIWDTNNQQIARDAYAAGVAARASGEEGQRAPVAPDGWRKKFFDALPKWFDEDARHTAYSKIEPLIDQLAAAPSSSEAALREAIQTCKYQLEQFIRAAELTKSQSKRLTEIFERLKRDANSQPVRGVGADAPTAASEQGESKP